MRILALGDGVGKPGRRLVEAFVPELRRETEWAIPVTSTGARP